MFISFYIIYAYNVSKEKGKDQGIIQSITTPDPIHHIHVQSSVLGIRPSPPLIAKVIKLVKLKNILEYKVDCYANIHLNFLT